MSAVILDPKKESLRITCGQCGDTFELIFEQQGEELRIDVVRAEEILREHAPECYISPVHIVT